MKLLFIIQTDDGESLNEWPLAERKGDDGGFHVGRFVSNEAVANF